ncbi:hypothetical protein AB7645_05520 [Bradyrhizobium sp. 956_D2_N1_5]|uniref:hypothetical protein n=1 Tax=unclassified Bradyrhizobium TaxID=2631580 RepID=UPI003F28EECE
MTEESGAIILEGREAWARLRGRGEKTFSDWVAVGKALALGRAHCLKVAETNRPFGTRYTAAMALWLESNGLDGLHQQERWWALKVVDNLAEIDNWRANLDDASRRRWNHPQSAWDNWRRSQGHARPRRTRRTPTLKQRPRTYARPVFWGQDHLRRAANAIRECRSSDCIVLARAALEAAIPNEAALFTLLERPEPPKSAKMIAPVMASAMA